MQGDKENSVNSWLVNVAALSDTTTSGKPKEAKDFRISSIVADDVNDDVMWISCHFE